MNKSIILFVFCFFSLSTVNVMSQNADIDLLVKINILHQAKRYGLIPALFQAPPNMLPYLFRL